MSKVGYIYNTQAIDVDIFKAVMYDRGCTAVYEDSPMSIKPRQNWEEMLKSMKPGSSLYIVSLANALTTPSGLTQFISYIKSMDIRLVSLGDGWDTDFIVYTERTGFTVRNILKTIAHLPEDIRKQKNKKKIGTRVILPRMKADRQSQATKTAETVINLYFCGYKIKEIERISGRKARRIHEILRQNGIQRMRCNVQDKQNSIPDTI